MKTELQRIPGVGKAIEQDLIALGYPTIDSLRGVDPEALYLRDCARCGGTLDRCMLYVYRGAVYFAEHAQPEPEKCRWWYWKDHTYPEEGAK